MVEPSGRSGGLICVWDPGTFTRFDCVKESNFFAIIGKIKGCSEVFWLVNVYAPQKIRDKKKLWDRLTELRNEVGGLWMLMGDFNAVRIPEDRKVSSFNPICAKAFNNFIFESDFHEYEMKGNKYTFAKKDNGRWKFSKIDRFLVGNDILERWPLACLRALPGLHDYGPKPFRDFNSWLDIKDFIEVVGCAWREAAVYGPADLRLMLKLKHLREQFKIWRNENRDKEGEEKDRCKEELAEMDLLMETKELNDEESWIRTECIRRISELEEAKAKDLKQKS